MKASKPQTPQVNPQLQKLDRKLKKAAQMYEEQFLRQMVKAMRQSVSHSALTKPGMAERIYRGQMDEHTVESWVENGGTGFADMIYQDLVEKFYPQLQKQKPQGIRPADITDRFRGIQQSKTSPETKSHSFKIDLNDAQSERSYLKLPWKGRLNNIFQMESGESVAQVSHETGLLSTFVFKGKIEPGLLHKNLQQGENFAQLSSDARNLTWQIQYGDSRKDSSGKENPSFN